jgi:TonB family protein
MNRLQKKCFIASTSLHVLLALVFVVCSAFLSSPSHKSEDVAIINFIPAFTVNSPTSGGGNPNAALPPPAPVNNPTPPTPPAPAVQPDRNTATAEPQREREHVVVPNLTPVRPTSNKTTPAKPPADPNAAANAARQRMADQIRQAAQGIRGGVSGKTSIELKGPGGGGLPYAGFDQAVLAAYDRAWISPEGMDASEAVVEVRVVVDVDGKVSSARITRRSGDPRVDLSVQQALDRVTFIPVPDGTKEPRTVEFNFKSRNKAPI